MSTILTAPEFETATEPITKQPDPATYARCSCIGVAIGRACTLCANQKWLKRCAGCLGAGVIYKSARSTASKDSFAEKHGMCGGRGWLACPRAELPLAVEEEQLRQSTHQPGPAVPSQTKKVKK